MTNADDLLLGLARVLDSDEFDLMQRETSCYLSPTAAAELTQQNRVSEGRLPSAGGTR